jgi:cytochrome b
MVFQGQFSFAPYAVRMEITTGAGTMQTIKVWDPFVRVFHWLLVLTFSIAWISGESYGALHTWSGYAVAGLVLLRILWGVIGTRHARFSDFIYRPAEIRAFLRDTLRLRSKRYLGHNPAGGAMILAMLALLLVTAFTGIAYQGMESGTGMLAGLAGAGGRMREFMEELHEFSAGLMLLLVALHVAGVIVESLIHRENLVKAMFSGHKPV